MRTKVFVPPWDTRTPNPGSVSHLYVFCPFSGATRLCSRKSVSRILVSQAGRIMAKHLGAQWEARQEKPASFGGLQVSMRDYGESVHIISMRMAIPVAGRGGILGVMAGARPDGG